MSRGPKARKEKLSIYLAKNPKVDDVSLLKIENTKPSILLEIEGFESSKRNFARNGYESAAVHQVASVIVDIHHEQVYSYSSGFV
ncbi:hypothetical protein [Pseudomonas sp. MWU13-2105]|uniref:hypothetical protein n=1 Tax=Pseudomonas sp. MWU13-2105 TaxID=2935074 RepID=UPI00200DBE9D|nr:hypothetical protein [Pseudomonas sp. MWU13-2105]